MARDIATIIFPTGRVYRALRLSYRFAREAPTIPTVILGVLVFVAIFAPLIAPHDKLQPVVPSAAACQDHFGFSNCPYIDDLPPVWQSGGSWSTPLGRPSGNFL